MSFRGIPGTRDDEKSQVYIQVKRFLSRRSRRKADQSTD